MTTPSRNELTQLFTEPPIEYGDFMTYFWECGKLSKEQLTWQLEQLKDKGVSGTLVLPAVCAWRTVWPATALLER